jgi:hypothetical protein
MGGEESGRDYRTFLLATDTHTHTKNDRWRIVRVHSRKKTTRFKVVLKFSFQVFFPPNDRTTTTTDDGPCVAADRVRVAAKLL